MERSEIVIVSDFIVVVLPTIESLPLRIGEFVPHNVISINVTADYTIGECKLVELLGKF